MKKCTAANSILESELHIILEQKSIKEIKVMEIAEGFYVLIKLTWPKEQEYYLTTRRIRTTPKIFKDLKRLNNNLKNNLPKQNFTVLRNQKLPT